MKRTYPVANMMPVVWKILYQFMQVATSDLDGHFEKILYKLYLYKQFLKVNNAIACLHKPTLFNTKLNYLFSLSVGQHTEFNPSDRLSGPHLPNEEKENNVLGFGRSQ